MKKLNFMLENCYGIRNLHAVLDYSNSSSVAIYAPNGAMKSSLANTFQDIADGVLSRDRIFQNRITRREIRDEMGVDLGVDSILVLRPYEEVAEQGGETAALLVNLSLRQQYEALYAEVNAARIDFLNAVKVQAKTKRDVEREISFTFTASEGQLDIALIRMKPVLESQQDMSFSSIDYDVVADEKVLAFLETEDFRVAIDDYVKNIMNCFRSQNTSRKEPLITTMLTMLQSS
ncbi:hypothetical protein [Chromobacterium vaccinii]|uniref:hypothetical protein n=1 Tax=Chromobacterium vaccinii TaxID=1108595 RepID=UPI000E1853B6|nr:hypothetical protein [Chromobacterium vaccinii]SUX53536.1 Uncharacterised protein [Chromobacterium vaccinii]